MPIRTAALLCNTFCDFIVSFSDQDSKLTTLSVAIFAIFPLQMISHVVHVDVNFILILKQILKQTILYLQIIHSCKNKKQTSLKKKSQKILQQNKENVQNKFFLQTYVLHPGKNLLVAIIPVRTFLASKTITVHLLEFAFLTAGTLKWNNIDRGNHAVVFVFVHYFVYETEPSTPLGSITPKAVST